MKPEPFLAPPARQLTDDEHLLLRVSASGGAHPVRPAGASQWAAVRRLEKLGLVTVADKRYTVTVRGAAAISN